MDESQRTEAQEAAIRRRCLNGVCKMTKEERKARRRKYVDEVLADPERHALYTEYFRKRRARPGVRERINAQAWARYHADIEKSREKCREKYRRMMADPERHAAFLERRRKRMRRTDGTQSLSARRAQIRKKLIPRWERVIAEGREDAYCRRTTHNNAILFHMYIHNRPLFDEMLRRSYKSMARR